MHVVPNTEHFCFHSHFATWLVFTILCDAPNELPSSVRAVVVLEVPVPGNFCPCVFPPYLAPTSGKTTNSASLVSVCLYFVGRSVDLFVKPMVNKIRGSRGQLGKGEKLRRSVCRLIDSSSDRSQHRVPALLVCEDKHQGVVVRWNVREAKGAVFAPLKVTRRRRAETNIVWRQTTLQPRRLHPAVCSNRRRGCVTRNISTI